MACNPTKPNNVMLKNNSHLHEQHLKKKIIKSHVLKGKEGEMH